MSKEKLEGISLQFCAIFARLDALKQSLPKENLEKYNQLIEQNKNHLKETYNVNVDQLEEWF
jgi:hypothetical protein